MVAALKNKGAHNGAVSTLAMATNAKAHAISMYVISDPLAAMGPIFIRFMPVSVIVAAKACARVVDEIGHEVIRRAIALDQHNAPFPGPFAR